MYDATRHISEYESRFGIDPSVAHHDQVRAHLVRYVEDRLGRAADFRVR